MAFGQKAKEGPPKLCGWLFKLWSLFASLLQYGTYYLGYPKRHLNFDNYPCSTSEVFISKRFNLRSGGLGIRCRGSAGVPKPYTP